MTLFARGDSIMSAGLVECTPRALRLDRDVRDPMPHQMLLLDRVRELVDEFSMRHLHTEYLHFPYFGRNRDVMLTTLHDRQDLGNHTLFEMGNNNAAALLPRRFLTRLLRDLEISRNLLYQGPFLPHRTSVLRPPFVYSCHSESECQAMSEDHKAALPQGSLAALQMQKQHLLCCLEECLGPKEREEIERALDYIDAKLDALDRAQR